MNPVVHFELPYDDAERIAKFYAQAFDWQTRQLGAEMGHYVLAMTTESDDQGPKAAGVINGGFYARKPSSPAQQPSVVIAVHDIATAMQKIAAAGGKVLGEPMDIPGVGRYLSFLDTEGNRGSVLEPLPRG
ncbi:MAG TPA: VOC family protein [Gammaproteobacteria bacterium]|nr:VOC family protein [Gammaproteobacteria bacterium]